MWSDYTVDGTRLSTRPAPRFQVWESAYLLTKARNLRDLQLKLNGKEPALASPLAPSSQGGRPRYVAGRLQEGRGLPEVEVVVSSTLGKGGYRPAWEREVVDERVVRHGLVHMRTDLFRHWQEVLG
jgi:hypothetical protein